MDAPGPGGLGGTYAGNPLAIAAARTGAAVGPVEARGVLRISGRGAGKPALDAVVIYQVENGLIRKFWSLP